MSCDANGKNCVDFPIGLFVQAAISFVIIAAVVYFFVVVPMQKLMDRFKTEPEPDAPVKDCPECLSKIPEAARRCAYCTAEQSGAAPVVS